MAAKIEQFRKLHVVGEPLVLHDIWDRVIAQEPRENVSSLRGEGARTLRLPSQAHERFGRKQFHIEALRTRNIGWLTRHSSEENYEKSDYRTRG